MRTEQAVTRARGYRVAAFTLMVALAWAGSALGQDESGPSSGRGWIWGGGISGGRLGFPGGEDVVLAVSEVTGELTVAGETFVVRTGEVVDASGTAATGATRVAPLPSREPSAGFSFHVGYAFSRRAALILQAELVAGVRSGFSSAQGGLVLRVWPASRLWLEAGPASGDLRYGYEGAVVEEFTDTGYGVRTGAGFTVLRKPRWGLDIEARLGTLAFEGFRATSVTVGLSASSRPR
jgi:hypothetical protein